MSEYTHATYSMGFTVEPDLKSYYPATLSRWRLFLAAVGLKKLPDLYRAADYGAAIKRAQDVMTANMLEQPFRAADDEGMAGLKFDMTARFDDGLYRPATDGNGWVRR